MYWTITVILFVLWVVGLITGSTEGHWVHLFLLFAMASLLLALMGRGRRGGAPRNPLRSPLRSHP